MIALDGDKREKRCFGCGQFGHMRGDENCTTGKDAIWGGAPKAYLDKVQRRFGLTPNGPKRAASSAQKPICPYWSSGDGYCKYAERCKFDHSGPQGGGKGARGFERKGKGKGKGKGSGKGKGRGGREGGKGNRTSMIVKKKTVQFSNKGEEGNTSLVVCRSDKEDDGEDSDAENELYNLMRGRTSLMIAATSEDSDDESEESDQEEVDQGHESSKEKSELESSSEVAPENGEHCRTSSTATPQ
jgi:hypothetical protein